MDQNVGIKSMFPTIKIHLFFNCFSGALKRSKHMPMKNMELRIKEMLSIVGKLSRCTLRSIVYVIVFIQSLTSYT